MALRKNVLISFGTNFTVYFFQFVTTIVVSRLLTPVQVGLFAVSVAISMILQELRDFGVSSYIVQEKILSDEKVRAVFALALLVGWPLAAILFVSRSWIAAFYQQPEIGDILAVLSIGFIVFPFGLPALGMLRRQMKVVKIAIISISASLSTAIVSITLAYLGFGALALSYGALCGAIVSSGLALAFSPEHLKLRPSFTGLKLIGGYGLTSTLATVLQKTAANYPELVIGKFLGFDLLGFFVRGKVLPVVVERLSYTPLQSAMVPDLAQRLRLVEPVHEQVSKLIIFAVGLGWPLLAFMSMNSVFIVRLLYGTSWLQAHIVLSIFCVNQAILLLNYPALVLFEATGSVRKRLFNESAIQFIFVMIVSLALTYGLMAIALAVICSSLFALFLNMRFVEETIKVNMSQLLRPALTLLPLTVPPILSAILTTMLWPNIALNPSIRTSIFTLCLNGTLSLGFCVLLLSVIRPPLYFELRKLVNKTKVIRG